jgi:predicted metal-dependent hydrolase
MNTETRNITVGGLSVEMVRKDIKNLHLGVYPPHGRVRVAVPLMVSDDAVRLAVIGKLGWIKQQRARFDAQPRQSQREMVNGESHYFLGRRYRLRVIQHDAPGRIALRGNSCIELYARREQSAEQRERVLHRWYREQLKALLPALLEKWQSVLDVQAAGWGIKKMKTRWGSCSSDARRVWFNLELAKKPVQCLEYVVVHELAHLLERHHTERFRTLMDGFLPSWRLAREELKRSPLSHEQWQE